MEPGVPGGEILPLSEDRDILTVVDVVDDDDDFENLYDVPFVTVNRVGNEIEAEIVLSGVVEIDYDRLDTAQAVAAEKGFRAYARVFGDLYEDCNVVTILFTDDPAKGLIWALENEVGNAWLQ